MNSRRQALQQFGIRSMSLVKVTGRCTSWHFKLTNRITPSPQSVRFQKCLMKPLQSLFSLIFWRLHYLQLWFGISSLHTHDCLLVLHSSLCSSPLIFEQKGSQMFLQGALFQNKICDLYFRPLKLVWFSNIWLQLIRNGFHFIDI